MYFHYDPWKRAWVLLYPNWWPTLPMASTQTWNQGRESRDSQQLLIPWIRGPRQRIKTKNAFQKKNAAKTKLCPIWNDRNVTLSSKIRLMRSMAISISRPPANRGYWQLNWRAGFRKLKWDATADSFASYTKKNPITNAEVQNRVTNAEEFMNIFWQKWRDGN